MKKNIFFITVLFLISTLSFAQIIINHTCTEIGSIPESAINQAKSDLHIAYGHTSHGSQLITGMNELDEFMGGNNLYVWHDGPQEGYLDIDDYFVSGDLGSSDWDEKTREYLDDPANSDVNVVIWSWCGQLSYYNESQVNDYLSDMTSLENDYPDVKFVYMTGHLDGNGLTGTLHTNNEHIREYCINNNKILYDFADIETYDPDNTYFGDKIPNDNCDYDSNGDNSRDANWATEWQNSHTEDTDWYGCSCAHSQALNCNQKAYTAWWLWARLAGWDGTPVPVELTTFYADVNGNSVSLNWNTATEVNNYGFEIQRVSVSRNNTNNVVINENTDWEKIGFVEGNGNSNTSHNYNFIDNPKILSGKYFYRLKQIDFDGSFEYSDIIEIDFDLPGKFNLSQNYPNPFNPTTTIQYSTPPNPSPSQGEGTREGFLVSLKVYNILGKEVATLVNENQEPGTYKITWDATNQPNGIYYYQITVGNFIETKSMVLLK